MADYQTWGQCLDYTLKTRDSWVHGNGRPTAIINTSHFTRHYGRGLRVSKIDQAFMDLYVHELEKEGKSLAPSTGASVLCRPCSATVHAAS